MGGVIRTARGEEASPPSPTPPDLLDDDAAASFQRCRADALATFCAPGVIDKTGPALGVAFADQLLHGWDLARATRQDATMPEDLPGRAYQLIHGRFTDEQRKGVFKPALAVPPDASPQETLLAYTGRNPSS